MATGDFAQKFGVVLKAINLSRGRLAQTVGVDKSVVSRWASGVQVPSDHNLSLLTEAVARHRPGFERRDWDLDAEGFANRLDALYAGASSLEGPSIAVLPFQNMSGDPEQEYFADGMVEDIITALSRFKSLFVIARNSTFAYKGKAIDVRKVGRGLGVRHILQGQPKGRQPCPRYGAADRLRERQPSPGGTLRSRARRHLRGSGRDHPQHRLQDRAARTLARRSPSASMARCPELVKSAFGAQTGAPGWSSDHLRLDALDCAAANTEFGGNFQDALIAERQRLPNLPCSSIRIGDCLMLSELGQPSRSNHNCHRHYPHNARHHRANSARGFLP